MTKNYYPENYVCYTVVAEDISIDHASKYADWYSDATTAMRRYIEYNNSSKRYFDTRFKILKSENGIVTRI